MTNDERLAEANALEVLATGRFLYEVSAPGHESRIVGASSPEVAKTFFCVYWDVDPLLVDATVRELKDWSGKVVNGIGFT